MILILFFPACASNKAGLKSPELPARHWLEEAPGVPVENKAKLEAAVPNLYDADKNFSFEDCVFLTIQQSPLLVNSAVDLEIKRVALTSAVWKYLPEPRMTFQVSNNLTRLNMDNKDTPGDYGRTKLQVGFYAAFPNPVATYFEHQVQKIMVNLAISTHRKAIGEAVYKIAQSYLKLQAQSKIVAAQKELLPVGKELIAYWQQVESVEGRQGVSLNLATQHQRELELTVDKTRMEELACDPHAYIRPSPSAGSLGGVARKTREAMILCETAGFDIILIETVGVGQSETAVHSMVAYFLLVQIAGAGDELQGIKRGIMEMADSIIINKADGNNIQRAELAKAQLQTALHFFPPHESGVMPKVMTCSAYERTGIDAIWENILHYCSETQQNGYFDVRRAEQSKYWMYETIDEQLRNHFYQSQKENLKIAEKQVMSNQVSSFAVAFELLDNYFNTNK